MLPDTPQAQHDRQQRKYRSTRVRHEDQVLVPIDEKTGQTSSKKAKEGEQKVQRDRSNAIMMLFLILCLSLISYALIREFHGSSSVVDPGQYIGSAGFLVTE
ncbi:hypothetical protein ASD24_24870 [Paenibacillus sp. Root52]|uniref:hypothetical protein n=1 Tax=Paenibacillus sp. Root52 TaxID=1736552 RepID=UPI0006F27D21|nr:hypothetical protein [Paenibacillus sp. Root52]KQY91032.1 hypothetical protein ASD24_24870 [Paenibacillus sp. Root52]